MRFFFIKICYLAEVKRFATIAIYFWLLAPPAAYGQHVLQLLAARPAEAKLLARYRYQQEQPDAAAALQQAHAVLQQLYADAYLQARFTAISQTDDSTVAYLAVGEPYTLLSLRRGNVEDRLLQAAGYRERFYRQRPFSHTQIHQLMQRLLTQAERSGHPFALLRLDSLEVAEKTISAALYYEPGPYITFDSIQLAGDAAIKKRFLAAHLGIKPGEAFHQQRIDEVVQKLQALPYLQLAEAPRLSFQNRQAQLWLNLKARPANRVDGILGLQSKPEGGVLITGQLDLLLQNPFGGGKTMAINWQRLNEASQQLALAYRHPYLFNSPISLALAGGLLKEQEQFLNRHATVALQRQQAKGLLLSLVYEFKDARLLDQATGPNLAGFRVNKYGLRAVYQKLDNALFPRQGYQLGGGLLAGPKEVSQLTDGATGQLGTSLQAEASVNALTYIPLARSSVLALIADGALLYDKNLFLPDLYRLGGLQSLRGFREKSLFASSYVLFQAELRQQFGNSSYVFLFYDQAWLSYKMPTGAYQDWPLGAGAGLSLTSGPGLFSLVYALGHQQNQSISLRNSQLHFGYTSRF